MAFSALMLTACPEKTTEPAASGGAVKAQVAPATQVKAVAPATQAKAVAPGAQMTIAELFAQKDALTNKTVTLQGKVTKYNANIMGSNWIHIQDGSGGAGTNDLTLTTKAVVAVGDMVKVTGALTRAKDFGAGYKFDVIIENAQVEAQ